jgi:16S rRNA (cytidine1402-2'-O)-methyltransferase
LFTSLQVRAAPAFYQTRRYTLKCLPGILYLVATPIGNLEDITLRALRILREEVAIIVCEDTRQTQKLLRHFTIKKPLLACHEHNEAARAQELVELLERGDSVALVSDAGTPLISDPGYRVVSAAVAAGISVVSIPGPSAALAALAASGLPTNEFRFIGFLPPKQIARRKALASLAQETATVIAYESPHRILESLKDIEEELGARPIALARELTKIHEEFLRGSAAEVYAVLSARNSIKGEITLVIGRAAAYVSDADPLDELAQLEAQGMRRMDAIKLAAKRLGLPKREVYRRAAERGNNPPDTHRD